MKALLKRFGNYSLIDNTTLQCRISQVSHYLVMWFVFPVIILGFLMWAGAWLQGGMSRNALVASIVGDGGLIVMAILGYKYYVPKGHKKYFYVVCLAPMLLGLMLTIACVAVVH